MTWEVKIHARPLGVGPGNDRVVCPICKAPRPYFCVIDVSALPHELTGGAAYACDGCWTRWEREERLLADGTIFDEARMYELMEAPKGMVKIVRDAHNRALRQLGRPSVEELQKQKQ